ncbi:MAG: hypothetical protein ACF8QF_02850 [Phycisphaerales bacterium]
MTQQQAGPAAPEAVQALLQQVRERAERAGVFDAVSLAPGRLACAAREAAAPAEYRVEWAEGRLWAGLYTEDRWLSQSIEADLVHTGDKMEDLVDEELVDLGCDAGPLPVEHFRSEDMLYTFRSALPIDVSRAGDEASIGIAASALLAYEAAFRELGDMAGGDEDE